jgi:hypothetical protein
MTLAWTDDEIAELGPGLRQFVEASLPRGRGVRTCSICGEQFRQRGGLRSRHCRECRLRDRRKRERERIARRRGVAAAPLAARNCEAGNPDQPQAVFVKRCRVHPDTVRRCRREPEEAGAIPFLAHRHGPAVRKDEPTVALSSQRGRGVHHSRQISARPER